MVDDVLEFVTQETKKGLLSILNRLIWENFENFSLGQTKLSAIFRFHCIILWSEYVHLTVMWICGTYGCFNVGRDLSQWSFVQLHVPLAELESVDVFYLAHGSKYSLSSTFVNNHNSNNSQVIWFSLMTVNWN